MFILPVGSPTRNAQRACETSLALVFPSIYECGGAVVLEAMAMGKPVIATRWGGPWTIWTNPAGSLSSHQSYRDMVDGFAEAMTKLMNSHELANIHGRCWTQKSRSRF